MTDRRRWKAEEKLAIIKEVKEKGKVVETCRKYSIDPGMYSKWKESYDTFGLDGLKPHYRRMESKVRKLMKENEKLKKLLAEKELENALLSDALKKKDGEETMNMANEYIDRRLRISDIVNILHIP